MRSYSTFSVIGAVGVAEDNAVDLSFTGEAIAFPNMAVGLVEK